MFSEAAARVRPGPDTFDPPTEFPYLHSATSGCERKASLRAVVTKEEHVMSQKQNSSSSEEPKPVPMEQPLKKHGDKMDVGSADNEDAGNQTGGAGEPRTTPLEPEKQGGISGP